MPNLKISINGKSVKPFEFHKDIVVGRSDQCDLCLPLADFSRRHFSLSGTPAGWLFSDLGSTNGTKIEGSLTNERLLDDGDVLDIGPARLTFYATGISDLDDSDARFEMSEQPEPPVANMPVVVAAQTTAVIETSAATVAEPAAPVTGAWADAELALAQMQKKGTRSGAAKNPEPIVNKPVRAGPKIDQEWVTDQIKYMPKWVMAVAAGLVVSLVVWGAMPQTPQYPKWTPAMDKGIKHEVASD